eukprot:PhF_6_TR37190/c0_g1_i2/m.54797
MQCPDHDGEPYEYFCVQCNVFCCSYCVLVGDHTGHTFTSRSAAPEAFSDSLKTKVDSLSTRLESTIKEVGTLESRTHDRSREIDQEIKNISKEIEALTERKQNLEVTMKTMLEQASQDALTFGQTLRALQEESVQIISSANSHQSLCAPKVLSELHAVVGRTKETIRRVAEFTVHHGGTSKASHRTSHQSTSNHQGTLSHHLHHHHVHSSYEPPQHTAAATGHMYDEVIRHVGEKWREMRAPSPHQPTHNAQHYHSANYTTTTSVPPPKSPLSPLTPPHPTTTLAEQQHLHVRDSNNNNVMLAVPSVSPVAAYSDTASPTLKQLQRLKKCLRDSSVAGGAKATKSILTAISHLRSQAERHGVQEVLAAIQSDKELSSMLQKLDDVRTSI